MFEQDQDINKEKKAVELYLRRIGGSYKKLSPDDVDFRIIGENKIYYWIRRGKCVGYRDERFVPAHGSSP